MKTINYKVIIGIFIICVIFISCIFGIIFTRTDKLETKTIDYSSVYKVAYIVGSGRDVWDSDKEDFPNVSDAYTGCQNLQEWFDMHPSIEIVYFDVWSDSGSDLKFTIIYKEQTKENE